jgi:Arc-like DNA binding domain
MPPWLRAQLQAAAKRKGRSMSQELISRLASSFHREREEARDPAMRALCFLIADTAHSVSGVVRIEDDKPVHDWRTNPFMFEAFKLAVGYLLDALRPKGEIVSPFEGRPLSFNAWHPEYSEALRVFSESYETPEARGRIAFATVWNALLTSDRENVQGPAADLYAAGQPWGADESRKLHKMMEREQWRTYGMSDARHALDPTGDVR